LLNGWSFLLVVKSSTADRNQVKIMTPSRR
jgi:hypothetical protein